MPIALPSEVPQIRNGYATEHLRNVTIEIIDTCNLACRLCYTESSPKKNSSISTEDVLQLVDRLKTTAESIAFTGGEAFLHPGLEEICRRARPHIEELSVLTNATDLTDEQLDWVAELDVKLGISIDGRESVHDHHRGAGSFYRTTQTMLRARQRGIRFWIQTILGDFSFEDLEYIVQLADHIGAYGVAFQRPKKIGRANARNAFWMSPLRYREVVRQVHTLDDRYPKLQILIKDALYNCEDTGLKAEARNLGGTPVVGGCRAGLTYLYVEVSGNVLMCPFVPTVVGNIYDTDIFEIWSGGNELDRVRTKESYPTCSKCQNFSVCRGCRAEALAWTGDLMGDDPNCWQKAESSDIAGKRTRRLIPLVPA